MVDAETLLHPIVGHCAAAAVLLYSGAHDDPPVVTEVVLNGWGGHLRSGWGQCSITAAGGVAIVGGCDVVFLLVLSMAIWLISLTLV